MPNAEVLQRRIEREIKARKEAEDLLERKSLELYETNQKLENANIELQRRSKNLESSLSEIEQEYEAIIESLSEMVYRIDDKGNFSYINKSSKMLLGFTSEELIGKHFTELLDETNREKVYDDYMLAVQELQSKSYKEILVRDKKGEMRWFGQSVSFEYRTDNTFKGGVAVARDITEVVAARKALEDSEEKYRGLINGMQLGLMEVGLDGRIITAYPWFCDMVGYTLEELRGQDADALFLTAEDKRIMDRQSELRKKGQAGVYEIRIKRKDGSFIWVAISGAPFYDPKGNVIGTIGVHLDITKLKKLQEDLQIANTQVKHAKEAEHKFFMNMSHEIRTPLNAVIGMTHLLEKTPLDDMQQELVDDLLYSSRMLQGLISNILDISKIESGGLEPSFQEIQLADSVTKILNVFRVVAKSKNIELKVNTQDLQEAWILTDESMFNQILTNLVSNSIKFTEQGNITVSVRKIEKQGSEWIEVQVKDTGIGIKDIDISRIFERHYRVDATAQAEGNGLGLAITRELINALGGEIEVGSYKDVGTTVTILLPYIAAEGKTTSWKSDDSSPEFIATDGQLVLLVEDNIMNQRYVSRLLTGWGIDYLIADSIASAKLLLEASAPDLILLDLQLPDGSGHELAKYLRTNEFRTPIVAITASAYIGHRELALSNGIDDYLTKPYPPEQLRHYIHKHLSHVSAESTPFSDLTGDSTYREMMLSLFLTEIPAILSNSLKYIAEVDPEALSKELHKLSPMLDLALFPVLAQKCRELEPQLRNGEAPVQQASWMIRAIEEEHRKLSANHFPSEP